MSKKPKNPIGESFKDLSTKLKAAVKKLKISSNEDAIVRRKNIIYLSDVYSRWKAGNLASLAHIGTITKAQRDCYSFLKSYVWGDSNKVLPPCIATSCNLSRRKDGLYSITLLFPNEWQQEYISYIKALCELELQDISLIDKPSLFPVKEGNQLKAPGKLQSLYNRCSVLTLTSDTIPFVVDKDDELINPSVVKSLDTVSVTIDIRCEKDKLSFFWVNTQWLGTPKKGEYIVGTKALLELSSGYPELEMKIVYPAPGFRVVPATRIHRK